MGSPGRRGAGISLGQEMGRSAFQGHHRERGQGGAGADSLRKVRLGDKGAHPSGSCFHCGGGRKKRLSEIM